MDENEAVLKLRHAGNIVRIGNGLTGILDVLFRNVEKILNVINPNGQEASIDLGHNKALGWRQRALTKPETAANIQNGDNPPPIAEYPFDDFWCLGERLDRNRLHDFFHLVGVKGVSQLTQSEHKTFQGLISPTSYTDRPIYVKYQGLSANLRCLELIKRWRQLAKRKFV